MASNLPSSHERKTHETNHIRDMLKANSYKSAVISNILQKKPLSLTVPPPEQLVSMFFKWVEPSDTYKGFACLPYISSLTEPLTLGDYSITMKFKWSANFHKLNAVIWATVLLIFTRQEMTYALDDTHMNLWRLNVNRALCKDNKQRVIANLISIDIC